MWPFGRSRRDVDGSTHAGPLGRILASRLFRRARLPGTDAASLGLLGEKLARAALGKAGLKVLAANYRCPPGEIDLIALRQVRGAEDLLVFVEVKTRASDYHTDPWAAVDAGKQRRLRRCGDYYVRAHPAAAGLERRFDVISIVAAPGQAPRVEHIQDAF